MGRVLLNILNLGKIEFIIFQRISNFAGISTQNYSIQTTMKHFLNFLISFSLIIILVSCTGQSKTAGEQTAAQEQAPNQTIVTEQQTQSADQQIKALPGTQPQATASAQTPQTTINQPSKSQATTSAKPGEIVVGNEIGNNLGDFVNYDPDSVLIHLSDLRGKMVMVMLWNSLCHHCVVDNEKLREIYNKYHDKEFIHGNGFDIYSIALDKERSTWIEALNEKQYPWKNNVYVIDSWKDRDVRFFGIRNLPGSFLIDRDGIVLHKLFTPEELDKFLESYLVK